MRTLSVRSAIGIAAVVAVVSSAATGLIVYRPAKEGYVADGHKLAQACVIVIEVAKNMPNAKIALGAELFD